MTMAWFLGARRLPDRAALACRTSPHRCAKRYHSAPPGVENLSHTVAIVRDVPHSFVDALSMAAPSPRLEHAPGATGAASAAVSLATARRQHECYLQVLQRHVPTVLRLPAMEAHPDSVFVEDTAVAVGGAVCLTRPGAPSRRGEGGPVREALRRHCGARLGSLVDMAAADPGATCDGGDVLFTGRHLFVGLSGRTNRRGAAVLEEAFQHLAVPVVTVELPRAIAIASDPLGPPGPVLHLKSAVTHLDDATLLAPEGPLGDAILAAMGATARGYASVRLPDRLACNAVVVNRHVLAQDTPCRVSQERIAAAARDRGMDVTFVDTSEFAKKDGALTCCSILLSL